MKKKYLSVAIVLTIAASITMTSCIGSFALFNKVKAWNSQVGNKFVNELVFVAFWILPVYEVSILADVVVLNSIEFWSGSNPASASTKTIDGKNGKYLVKSDKTGYTITDMQTKEEVRFNFHEADNSWSVCHDGKDVKFMQFVDDNHVKMITPEGDFKTVELSEQGVWAYQQNVMNTTHYAMK